MGPILLLLFAPFQHLAEENQNRFRELFYGVSVYARRPVADPDVLMRFSASLCYLEVSVGLLRATGFPVLATGADRDHFDVQLLPDHLEDDPAGDALVVQAASRLVARAGDASGFVEVHGLLRAAPPRRCHGCQ
jgi:hypothetical protein